MEDNLNSAANQNAAEADQEKDLKSKRAYAKGSITRTISKLNQLVNDPTFANADQVNQLSSALEGAFVKFRHAHKEYHDTLDDGKPESDLYYSAVIQDVEEMQAVVSDWLADKEAAKDSNLPRNDLLSEMKAEIEMLRATRALERERFEEQMELEKQRYLQQLEAQRQGIDAQLDLKRLEAESQRIRMEAMQERESWKDKTPERGDKPFGTSPSIPVGPISSTPESSPEFRQGGPSTPKQLGSKPYPSSRRSWDQVDQSQINQSVLELTQVLCQAVNENQVQTRALVQSTQTPAVELDEFDGNPLNYCKFINSFDLMVNYEEIPDGRKLRLLLQYCNGEARSALEGCEVIHDPSVAYRDAREILRKRFGDKYTVAQAFINKIQNYPEVKEGDFRKYADALSGAMKTLQQLNYLHELETQQNLCTMITKLPDRCKRRWLTKNREIKSSGRHPRMSDLVGFVESIADEVSDSVYGKLAVGHQRSTIPKQSGKRTRGKGAFAVQTSAPPQAADGGASMNNNRTPTCIKCGGSHYVIRCTQFKQLSIKDRIALVQQKGLCVNCFGPNHIGRDCPRDLRCKIDGCGKKHSSFLHLKPPVQNFATIPQTTPQQNTTPQTTPQQNTTPQTTPQRAAMTPQMASQAVTPQNQMSQHGSSGSHGMALNTNSQSTPQATHQASCNFAGSDSGRVALPIVPVRVRAKGSRAHIDTYALLDTGTNQTFCSEALADGLAAPKRRETISLTTLECEDDRVDAFAVRLEISDIHDSNIFPLHHVLTRPRINVGLSSLVRRDDLAKWPHLNDLQLPEIDANEVNIIIGQDYNELIMPREVRTGEPGAPYATKTLLGWTLNGPVDSRGPKHNTSLFVQVDRILHQQVERFFKIDDLGGNRENMPISINDRRVMSQWENDTKLVDGHYTTTIPFKQRPPNLPDNRIMAEHRLKLLGKRLAKDSNLRDMYTQGIEDLLLKGYAEKIPIEAIDHSDGNIWYLPHHPVIHPRKPDKIRIVFDCAAKYRGVSLNDTILQGPDLNNKLVGVLIRFRQEAVALMADIEGMFHQIRVDTKDRDVLRFLWWEENDTTRDTIAYRMTAHLFGGVWSPSCAGFALRRCASDNQHQFDKAAVDTVGKNFYVDDCLKSVPSEDAAIRLVHQLCDLLKRGGFRLTKWLSNSRAVLRQIPEADHSKVMASVDLEQNSLPSDRALGVLWRVESDVFGFDVKVTHKPYTKRGLLSLMSSIYDPLGFASPLILRAKMLFQELCRRNCGWDEPMPEDICILWQCWVGKLPEVAQLAIPRCLKPLGFIVKEVQIHHFADASERAYGAVSYMRLISPEDSVHVAFLVSKAKLAPMKKTTIPRLELAAAVEAVKLDQMLRNELETPVTKSTFWTDSMIVLWYIQNQDKRYQTFVANRVAFICEITEPHQWRHVNSVNNPADDASRGLSVEELVQSSRWLNGPAYLWTNEESSSWPNKADLGMTKYDNTAEIKRGAQIYNTIVQPTPTNRLLCYFSSWHRLRRAVAWLLRWKQILQRNITITTPLRVSEVKTAELAILAYIQKGNLDCSPKGQCSKLAPIQFLGEEVWRVGGRLKNAPLPIDAQHPIILPAHHHVTKLIVQDVHGKTGHGGKGRVLSEIRQRYWILKGGAVVRAVLAKCIPCRKAKAAVQAQIMADLPKDRVTPGSPPFTFVGLDFFGPILVKRGRSEAKRYGCLFTCLTTRAIHLEVSVSLETDTFINCLQRFIARRGQPHEIRSDNGTNFVGGLAELCKALHDWDKAKIDNKLQRQDIQWIFNPPGASHMGGVWERMIRTVRAILNSLLKEQQLDDDGLHTLFCCVEGIVNGRPITKISDDPKDPTPLTPNHLLLLRAGPTLPPGVFAKHDLYRRRWRQVQYLADIFRTRWVKEYLPLLQERQRWTNPQRNLQEGDLVLVKHENTPRHRWPLGLVTSVYPGSDGLVRSVQLRMNNALYDRPMSKLCLLEMSKGSDVK